MVKPIIIQATFNKATTTVDGGWRMTFDTGQEEADQVTELSKRKHEVLYVVVMNEAQFKTRNQ